MIRIFIDGREGTTGLRLADRLSQRKDLELLTIPDELRKNNDAKMEYFSKSDIVFLCLPDVAAIESVKLAQGLQVRVIDTSTAHRVNPEWAYGFPELGKDFYERIQNGKNVAVPGCHASGFISLLYPLISKGILNKDTVVSVNSLTGYSGGGKKMIAEYESQTRSQLLSAPRHYGVTQNHKHLREMQYITGLSQYPVFSPIVCDFYSGMLVSVPLYSGALNGIYKLNDLREAYASFYEGSKLISVAETNEESLLSACLLTGRDTLRIYVNGNDERFTVNAVFDNLGKGASGAAIQCMNIMLGLEDDFGLVK